jgi:hypothetical protein
MKEEDVKSGTFKKTTNRNGDTRYFNNGTPMTKAEGEEQATLIKTYLTPTHVLQTKFKSSKLDGCTLGLPNLYITKVIEKSSASSCIIFEGIAFNEYVMVKASFKPLKPLVNNSLQVESRIYEEVVPLLSVHTPNVMPFLAKTMCTTLLTKPDYMKPHIFEKFKAQMNDINIEKKFNIDEIQLVITKKARGKTLDKWLESKKILQMDMDKKTAFLKDILFQIAYTLVIFEDFGLMHHDLHLGNVFVEKLPKPLHFSVNIGTDKTIVRDVNYFVQIYDFDQSAKVGTKFNHIVLNNTLLDTLFCKSIGQCNEFHKNVDWFTILYMINYLTYPEEFPIIGELLDLNFLNENELAFHGRPCKRISPSECTRVDLTNNDDLITSPFDYLCNYYTFCPSTQCEPQFSRPKEKKEEEEIEN